MQKSWKITKYNFWLQKVVKIQKQYHFWKLWTLIIYEFHRYFLRQPTLEGSTSKSIFFFSVLCGKAEKSQNVFFGYKKWSKFKSNITFENFGRYLYMNSTVVFRVDPLWKDLQLKAYFSLAFYAEKLKNHKIPFLVTKRGQNQNLMIFSDPRPKNCIFFIS